MKDWFGKYILGLPPLASENGQDVMTSSSTSTG